MSGAAHIQSWEQADPEHAPVFEDADSWPFTQVYAVTSELREQPLSPYAHLIPRLRELYEHAELPGDWSELAPGHAERLIGAELRVLPATDPRWRRVWAAWSLTRTIRKPICPLEQEERHIRDWYEWGMRQ